MASIPEDQSVAQRAAELRALGLFADRAALSDAELAAEVEAAWDERSFGAEFPTEAPFSELAVAAADTTRVWWRDLEADVVEENHVYVLTLNEWAEISVGAFRPTSVSEAWKSETGPVEISFELDGTQHVVTATYYDDWIDPQIATPINALIAASGRRFEFVQGTGQDAFVMALTAAEREAFEARGWCFE